jgi:hypothetical protein
MIIHVGRSVRGGGGPTFDYLGTRTWIIWHHLPDLSNSLRSGRCHSGLSRVRAGISRAGRAAGRWGRVRLCVTHRPRPEAGPCGLPSCCTDRYVQRVGARWGAQAGGGRAIFRGAAWPQPRCSTKSMKIIFRVREGLGLSAYGRMTPAPQRSHTRSRKQHTHLHHVPPHWLQASSESEQTCIRCASDPCGL